MIGGSSDLAHRQHDDEPWPVRSRARLRCAALSPVQPRRAGPPPPPDLPHHLARTAARNMKATAWQAWFAPRAGTARPQRLFEPIAAEEVRPEFLEPAPM